MVDIRYPQVHIAAITHPLEQETLLGVQKNGVYDHLARFIGSVKAQAETQAGMLLTGYPVTPKTSPRLHRIYQRVLQRLHCDQKYELYVDFGYELTAKTFGSGKTGHLIRVNSACLAHLSDGELAALLGHEVGHILADHIQNRELLESADLVTRYLPLANNIVKDTLWGFFSRWMVASDFTADRAALIASQSLEAVASLLLKQMGVSSDEEMIRHIYHQEIRRLPDNLGMFYVMMAQKMPSFGMVSRLQEICRWAISPEFGKSYAYPHYLARILLQDPEESEADGLLLLLHRRAANGNVGAQEKLGQLYLFGKGGVAMAPGTGLALLEEAAFNGGGNAMYIYSHCIGKEIHGLKKDPIVEAQLLRAAVSRGAGPGGVSAVREYPGFTDLPAIIRTFVTGRENTLQCTVNTAAPGEPLDPEIAQAARDAFWMGGDEKVYCLDMQQDMDRWFGTAISDKGIYGRMQDLRYPFFLSWKQFRDGQVFKRSKDGQPYLFCDDCRLFLMKEVLTGSIAEILIATKSLMDRS